MRNHTTQQVIKEQKSNLCLFCGDNIFLKTTDHPARRKYCNEVCKIADYKKNSKTQNGVKECSTCKVVSSNFSKRGDRDAFKSQCNKCAYLKNRIYILKHPETRKVWSARSTRKIKTEVVGVYSNGEMACECCKESHIEFLAIDHIAGNGNKERRETGQGGGANFYRWLKKRGYPSGYRVLCHNCNMSRGLRGYCPHEK